MCRHEAAEALGALGFTSSLELLKKVRDDENELDIMRETCDIAVDRIFWENSEERKAEKLKPRYFFFFFLILVLIFWEGDSNCIFLFAATSRLSTLPRRFPWSRANPRFPTWKRHCSIPNSLCSSDTVPCLPCAILLRPLISLQRRPLLRVWPRA